MLCATGRRGKKSSGTCTRARGSPLSPPRRTRSEERSRTAFLVSLAPPTSVASHLDFPGTAGLGVDTAVVGLQHGAVLGEAPVSLALVTSCVVEDGAGGTFPREVAWALACPAKLTSRRCRGILHRRLFRRPGCHVGEALSVGLKEHRGDLRVSDLGHIHGVQVVGFVGISNADGDTGDVGIHRCVDGCDS